MISEIVILCILLSIILGSIMIVWHFVDLINILNGDLNPEGGNYGL